MIDHNEYSFEILIKSFILGGQCENILQQYVEDLMKCIPIKGRTFRLKGFRRIGENFFDNKVILPNMAES